MYGAYVCASIATASQVVSSNRGALCWHRWLWLDPVLVATQEHERMAPSENDKGTGDGDELLTKEADKRTR